MKRGSYTVDPARAGQARISKGLTQADAADALHVNRVTLNKIENGRANTSLDLLERMSDLYSCSREWLLGEPDQIDPIEAGRERIAQALSKIGEGFEDLDAILLARAAQVREVDHEVVA